MIESVFWFDIDKKWYNSFLCQDYYYLILQTEKLCLLFPKPNATRDKLTGYKYKNN